VTGGIVRYGVHQALEDAATELIRKSLEGVTSMSEKSDILTPWKEQDRRGREVYSASGTPDASVRKGMYHRAWNPSSEHLNSRDGVVRGRRTESLASHVQENRLPGQEGPLSGTAGWDPT
jgi:hypothetical protein